MAADSPSIRDLQTLASKVGSVATGVAADTLTSQRYELRSINKPNNSAVAGVFDRDAGPRGKTGNPKGAFAVRFDTPGKGPNGTQLGYHLNFDTLAKNVKDPHVAVPSGVVKGAGVAAVALDGIRRAALPVAVVSDGVQVASAINADGGRLGTHTARAGAQIAGSWAGGIVGAELGAEGGAAAGGAIGALFGGVGAVPGAAVGGLIGGLAGAIAGAHIGASAGEHVADGSAEK